MLVDDEANYVETTLHIPVSMEAGHLDLAIPGG
jgi:hypothetical protein